MYNEDTRIVSIFKDYLIMDDLTEFMKRWYEEDDSQSRLSKIFKFYSSYSKVTPNYAVLPENKHLLKNITKKQKAVEERKKLLNEKKSKSPFDYKEVELDVSIHEEKLFDSKFIQEVKNMKYLEDKKEYEKMRFSRILDSFLENSSVMHTSARSISKDQTESIFSKQTSFSKLIPEQKQLQNLEKDPEFRFQAQMLQQWKSNRMVADTEFIKKCIGKLNSKICENKRKQLAKERISREEAKIKSLSKKIVLRTVKHKPFLSSKKRISLDDR